MWTYIVILGFHDWDNLFHVCYYFSFIGKMNLKYIFSGYNNRKGKIYCWRSSISTIYFGFRGVWNCWTASTFHLKRFIWKPPSAPRKYCALWRHSMYDWSVILFLAPYLFILLLDLSIATAHSIIDFRSFLWTLFWCKTVTEYEVWR